MSTVVKDWVSALPWKAQSALFSALRGPDNAPSPSVKVCTTWLRMVTQENADKHSGYMPEAETFGNRYNPIHALEGGPKALADEIGYCSGHFISHLLTGLSIVRYLHPDPAIRYQAWGLCEIICKRGLHVYEPTPDMLAQRFDFPDDFMWPCVNVVTNEGFESDTEGWKDDPLAEHFAKNR
jgi:hypothetical protein